ncbi:MAG TPA: SRPBCC family protein [Solimonas sp.]|nr:SRPBCC family protein [Solimonas sp.]
MPKHEVRLSARVNAPVEKVFAFFADHEKFTSLFGSRCSRIRDGQGDPNGLGSVRRLGSGLLSFDETIVAFVPNQQIDYQVTRGSPIKNHLGQIRFHSDGDGTAIDYVIRFDVKIPCTGGLIERMLDSGWNSKAPAVLKRLETA